MMIKGAIKMSNRYFKTICLAGLLCLAPNIMAQDEQAAELDSIAVTAKSKDVEIFKAPYSISIVTAEEISEKGHKSISDVLKSIPGMQVSPGSAGEKKINVRGQQVRGGVGIMIYIDDRKAVFSGSASTSVTQSHKLDDLPIEMIERIEIIKSPAASIYGAGASHGLIKIYTKKAEKDDEFLRGSITTGLGMWNTYKANTSFYGKKDQIDYTVKLGANKTDGYRDIDKSVFLGEIGLGWNIDNENRIGIKFGADTVDRLYPDNFLLISDLEANRDSSRIYFPARRGRGGMTPAGYQYPTERESILVYGGLDFQGKIEDFEIDSNLNISKLDEDFFEPGEVYDNGTFGRDENNNRTNDIVAFDLSLGKTTFEEDNIRNFITFGVDYEYFKYNNKQDNNTSFALNSTLETITNRYGIFVNNNFTYDKFSIATGLRYDNMKWDLENARPAKIGSSFDEISWDIAPSYRINDNISLFYSLSQSYWFPNAFHLGMPSRFAHTAAPATAKGQVPEENLNNELGIKHIVSKNFNYNVTLFHLKTKNKYVATYDGIMRQFGGFTGFKPAGNTTSKGVEISLSGKFSDFLLYRAGASYIDMTWDSGTFAGSLANRKDISGKTLKDTPKTSYTAGVTFFPIPDISVAVDMIYNGKAYANQENTTKYNSYLNFDAKVNYELSSDMSFYLLGSNILDKEHTTIHIPRSTPSYIPNDGRYIEIGFTKRF